MSAQNRPAARAGTAGADPENLEALIMRIARGDPSALGAFYDATARWVYGLASRILRNSAEAEEASLDAYMQVWRQAGSYSRRRGSPVSWLLTMARSRAIDRLRSGAARRNLERPLGDGLHPAAAGPDPFLASSEAERSGILRSAMSSLPPAERRAIELAYFSGLTHMEIAEQSGEPLGTVKTRIRRGMMRLRHLLGPLEDA